MSNPSVHHKNENIQNFVKKNQIMKTKMEIKHIFTEVKQKLKK